MRSIVRFGCLIVLAGCGLDERELAPPLSGASAATDAGSDGRLGDARAADGSRDSAEVEPRGTSGTQSHGASDGAWNPEASSRGSSGSSGGASNGGSSDGAAPSSGDASADPGHSTGGADSGALRSDGSARGTDARRADARATDASTDAPSAAREGGGGQACTAADEVICASACVNLGTNPDHCGGCGHSCGPKGSCGLGRCEPVALTGSSLKVSQLDVDDDAIYFLSNDVLRSCPLAGCVVQPTDIAAVGAYFVMAHGHFAFEQRALYDGALVMCPISGCGDAPTTLDATSKYEAIVDVEASDKDIVFLDESAQHLRSLAVCSSPSAGRCAATTALLNSTQLPYNRDPATFHFYVGPDAVYFTCPVADSGYDDLCRCSLDAACATPRTMNTQAFQEHAASAESLYSLQTATTVNIQTTIRVCPETGCTVRDGTTFAVVATGSHSLTVDASGVYWVEPKGTSEIVKMCPLTGCNGVPVEVAEQTAVTYLRLRGEFVYWIDTSQGASIVRRVAKPARK